MKRLILLLFCYVDLGGLIFGFFRRLQGGICSYDLRPNGWEAGKVAVLPLAKDPPRVVVGGGESSKVPGLVWDCFDYQ